MNALSSANLNAPINRLPNELLAVVFDATIFPDDWNFMDDPQLFRELLRTQQMTLCSVCRLWREICHSTPRLWTMFVFSYAHDETRLAYHEQMLEELLLRSANLDLDVFITIWSQETAVSPKLDTLLALALERARSVTLKVSKYGLEHRLLLRLLPLPATPRLKHCFVNMEDAIEFPLLFGQTRSFPLLSTLELQPGYPLFNITNVEIPNLVELSFDLQSLDGDIPSFIERCHHLRKLKIHFWPEFPQLNIQSNSVTDLSIVQIEGAWRDPVEGSSELGLGPFPQLQRLHLKLDRTRAQRILNSPAWMEIPSLQSLNLSELQPWAIDLNPLFTSVPNLVSIRLSSVAAGALFEHILPRDTVEDLPANTRPKSELVALPKLRRVAVVFKGSYTAFAWNLATVPWIRAFEGQARRFLDIVPEARVICWMDGWFKQYVPQLEEPGERFERDCGPPPTWVRNMWLMPYELEKD